MKSAQKSPGAIALVLPAKLTKADLAAGVIQSAAVWDAAPGEVFGGSADILKLEPGQVAGPLVYVGLSEKKLELDGDKVDVHTARDASAKLWRLPLSASFRNQLVESKLAAGDTFLVRRTEDALKKKGKGKGNPMRIYQVKITARAPSA